MSGNHKNPQSNASDNSLISNDKAGPDNTKRRLLKGAVGTTPVILAVTSKPVLAGWCTVSGMFSGNTSTHEMGTCGGLSPGYWMSKHGIPLDDTTTFKSVFGDVWEDGYGVRWTIKYDADGKEIGPLFREVCAMDGNDDHYQFGAHAVAAYMNAITYPDTYTPVAQVIQIVGEILGMGYYTDPSTGQTLDAQQAVAFIQQTFDVDY
jgi:hypothetical protein